MATDAEVNPLIHRGFIRPSKSLSPGTGLFWSWKEWRDPRHRTDGHTGSTTNANISITFGPIFFICISSQLLITPKNQIPITKSPAYRQAPNKFQSPMFK
jgi:hypothetical protein